ncbi:MAG: nitroreductase family protein [Firmicutes bacterium]|nr:nitroreductase family protein [Bacillota bacterium]
MDTWQAINARTSVREFKMEPVPEDHVEQLVQAAVRAPSAGNIQPWFFYIVTSGRLKNALAQAALGQGSIASAPVVIVVCAEPEASAKIYGDRGRHLYCLQDTAAALQNLMLAAIPLGLGTCWVGAFDEGKVAELLDMSGGRRPVAMVPVGYPENIKGVTPRKSLGQVMKYL